jgi:PAS domain-containing protein
MARLQAGQKVDHFETIRLAKDGRKLDVSVTISPLKDAEGRLIGASKIIRDITERKRNEQQLRLLSTAVQSAANGIAVADRAANLLWINPAFTRMTGYNSAEAVGQNPPRPQVRPAIRGVLPPYVEHPRQRRTLAWGTGQPPQGRLALSRRNDHHTRARGRN